MRVTDEMGGETHNTSYTNHTVPHNILDEYDALACFDRHLRLMLADWPLSESVKAVSLSAAPIDDVDKRLFLRMIVSKLEEACKKSRDRTETESHIMLWRMEWVETKDRNKEIAAADALLSMFRKEQDLACPVATTTTTTQKVANVGLYSPPPPPPPPLPDIPLVEGYIPHRWLPFFDN